MAADNKQANISRGSTNVDILLTKPVDHAMDKQLIILAIPKQTPPLTYNIDIQRLLEVVTINGTLLDESASSGKTKKDNIRVLMQGSGTCTLAWGANSEFSYTGNIVKCTVKQVTGRIPSGDGDSAQGIRTDTFEIMLLFSIGTHRG